jgi:MoaA/NifB/PqqE/SkfB family radical SAM enzyme
MTFVSNAPLNINWNYTYACNFHCSHCYSRAPEFPAELSTTEYLDIAAQIVKASVFQVGFGGGEPLLRRDLDQVLGVLGSGRVHTSVTTNGWFVDERMVDRLVASRLRMLAVSIDGIGEEHDRFRAKDGSFHRCVQALRISRARGLSTQISSVVSEANIHAVQDIVSLGRDEGVDAVNFKLFRPAGEGLINRDRHQLSTTSTARVIAHISDLQRSSGVKVTLYQNGSGSGCPCGTSSLALRPNGDVCPCPYSADVAGNIKERTLLEIWQNSPTLRARRDSVPYCAAEQPQQWPMNTRLAQLRISL